MKEGSVEEFVQIIKESDNIVFFGGAGVSTESGIPDFRSVDGLYNMKYDYPPETIISHSFFMSRPEEFYRFYRDKILLSGIEPNTTHRELARLEEMGIISPVINVNCDYKKTTTFSDKIAIKVLVKEFKGVKLFLSYEMKNEDGVIVCTASSTHAFLTKEGKPVRVQKEYPEFYKALTELAE